MPKYVKDDGAVQVKIIEPGQGSSAFYEKEQLERDAAIFKGAHIYWDHPTRRDASERPERSLRNLAGVIEDDPKFLENGQEGPGVYGTAHIFKPYRENLEEMAPYIGVSWRGSASAVTKKIGGKPVYVAERFTHVGSVDFVTKAGAGGQALHFEESALNEIDTFLEAFKGDHEDAAAFVEWAVEHDKAVKDIAIEDIAIEEVDMAEETKLKEIQESNTALTASNTALLQENAQLKERDALREAKSVVMSEVQAYNEKRTSEHKDVLPDVTCTRLAETLYKSAPIKDGVLDKVGLKATVAEAIKGEIAYIETITSTTKTDGIRGMGESSSTDGHDRLVGVLQETYRRTNPTRSEEEIKQMAETAARGR